MNNRVDLDRVVLHGVDTLHFFTGEGKRCPEDIGLPSAMRIVTEYLGENLGCKTCRPDDRGWGMGCSYAYFHGVTGLAFATGWVPGFDDRTCDMFSWISEDPAQIFGRACNSVGIACESVPQSAGEEVMREKILASLRDGGRPVLARGVVGPPEVSIITGYEEAGQVLVGTSFFQHEEPGIEVDAEGYFRRRGWYGNTPMVVVLGEKGPAPEQNAVLEDALKFGLRILRTTEMGGMPVGPAAYDAWAADLLDDHNFPTGSEAVLRQRHELHNFMVGQIAEQRWYGSVWLVNIYERLHYRQAGPLLKAAGCLADEHDQMWKIWDLVGGIGNPDAWQKLADPAVRQAIVPVIRASQASYNEAARWLETALISK
jgi:hypothetical protein